MDEFRSAKNTRKQTKQNRGKAQQKQGDSYKIHGLQQSLPHRRPVELEKKMRVRAKNTHRDAGEKPR